MSNNSINNAEQANTGTFLAALSTYGAVFGIEILVFTILLPRLPLIYEPRSRLPQESKRQDPIEGHVLQWPWIVFKADYSRVKRANGMDAYFFLRFLRMAVRIFLPIWLLSWLVLLPVDSVGIQAEATSGLDRFTFGNVSPDKQVRYAAHIILVYIFTGWICYNIKYEMRHFIQSRQHYLTSESHAASTQSRTLLITGIPSFYLTERQLFSVFSYLPGGVEKVWINRDLKDLPDVFKARQKAISKLESAETNLLATAAKIRQEGIAAQAKAQSKATGGKAEKPARPLSTESTLPLSPSSRVDLESGLTSAQIIVPKERRPRHRLAPSWLPFSLPFAGEVVDSIEWARAEIVRCNEILKAGRSQWQEDIATDDDSTDDFYKPLNSAFILFKQQIAAHLALQSVLHHEAYRMGGKYIEISQEDVIWSNLSLNPYEQRLRKAISYAITVGLILLWAFPVAFVGAVSNIKALCTTYHWLGWLCKLPPILVHVISGVLPPVLLALLMLLLPVILRLLARFEGIPSRSGLELSLMNRYFGFLVIHSFLVVTLSSGLIAALPSLVKDPASVPALLAQHLPQASNFFLTYLLLQGLSGTAGGFLQIITLLLYYVKVVIGSSSPRSVYNTKFGPRTVTWGTTFPSVTLIMVIAVAYSIISPIINGLACATFFLLYLLYKYLFLWCMQQPPSQDTGGLFFPKAIQHVFVGIYVELVCLCALFFLSRNEKGDASAIPEAILILILIVVVVFFHNTIIESYSPLARALPLTLADRTYGVKKDEPLTVNDGPLAATNKSIDDDTEPVPDPSGEASGVERYELQPRRTRSDPTRNGEKYQERTPHQGDIGEEGTAASVLEEPAVDTREDDGPADFTHPSVAGYQRILWLPMDKLGLAREEVAALTALGIEVVTAGAEMSERGHVEISAAPPDLSDQSY